MATTYNLAPSNSTASLANMTSGTTFAARARAAELNAVRARRASKELESDDDLLSTAPISLSAFTKFTKPRNKGRAWKALNLDEVQETPADSDHSSTTYTTFGELSFPSTGETTGNDRHLTAPSAYETLSDERSASQPLHLSQSVVSSPDMQPELSPESEKLARIVAGFDVDEWNPDMPPAATGNSRSMSRASSSQLGQHQQPSRPIAIRDASENSINKKELELGSSLLVALSEENKAFEEEQKALKKRDKLLAQEAKLASLGVLPSGEARLAQLGVMPPVQRASILQGPLGNRPAIPPPFTPRFTPSTEPYSFQTGSYLSRFDGGIAQPGYGNMNFDFRFPHGSQAQRQQQHQFHKGHMDATSNLNHYANPTMSVASPPRDYMPSYAGVPPSSKKEMLLQGLHDVVESSKAQGSLSSSARTVLYDPEARSNANQVPLANVASPPVASKTEKELFLASEELPWKDRPVNIHTVVTPILSNADLAALNKASTSQITPPTLAAVERHRTGIDLPSNGRFEEAERWWHTDVRGQDEVRKYVEQAADTHLSIRISQAAENMRQVRQQAILPESCCTLSTNPIPPANPEVTDLLVPLLANLHSYVNDTSKQNAGYFGRYARVPEWCIDKGQGGENSFFGEDWGAPPPRVGRDPRYRPLLHEGRYTVYEEMGVRSGTGYRW